MNTQLPFLLKILTGLFLLYSTAHCQEEIQLTQHPSNDRYASYSPDGKQILFESDRNGIWDIFVMDAYGKNQTPLTTDTMDQRRPAWHPSGQKILFESPQGLQEMNIAEKTRRTLVQTSASGGEIMFAQYSPTGDRVAFSIQKSNASINLAIFTLHDSSLTWITSGEFRNVYPSWSPDGKELICFSRRETKNTDDEIYRINLETKEWIRLTNWPKHNFCPSWSPNGKKIAYVTSMEGSCPEIYTMKKNGKKQKRITFNEDGDTLPRWSTDGKKLLLTAYRNGNYEICVIPSK